MHSPSMYSLDDPISAALQPPPNETKKERALRLKAEAEAKRLSDQIDEELKQERECLKQNKDDIKLLLLGEAQSVMKQFQLMYNPRSIAKRRVKLDEQSEFFLEHISRVANPDYVPTTDDILHPSIQAVGVQGHVFDVNIHGKSVAWHMYDVGGVRGKRRSWVPYFENINAIIFVVPVSDFDQYLEEDPRINRINDFLQLFTQICSNHLLKGAALILILNNTDLLKAKLKSLEIVGQYFFFSSLASLTKNSITSFGERSNDYDTVIQYFRTHFLEVYQRHNENTRVLYTHSTHVIDAKMIRNIIGDVRDSIFQGYLQVLVDGPD